MCSITVRQVKVRMLSDHLLALAHGGRATSASLLHGVGRAHGRESDTAAQVGGNEEGVVEVGDGSVH